jgi:hypothetical protein
MTDENSSNNDSASGRNMAIRAGLQAVGGAIPFLGGILSAAAGAWSEHEQEQVNKVFRQWLQMLEDEMREKAETVIELMARLDMNDEKIKTRIESVEYQSILKKAFRNWSNIDSESKRRKVRNLLANAAAATATTDDVVKLFLDWIDAYSEFHFEVIGEIYRNEYVTRGEIWRNLGRPSVREDSPEADLHKLLIRDLSTGGVIRQDRRTDAYGHFLKKPSAPSRPKGAARDPRMKSAFDDEEQYILTEMGRQFVHYVMNELAPRIEFQNETETGRDTGAPPG